MLNNENDVFITALEPLVPNGNRRGTKRRSSILKTDINCGNNEDRRGSRRVSWAQTFQYKELLADGTAVIKYNELTEKVVPKPPEVKENLPQNETINASDFINRLKNCNSVMDKSFSMCVTEADEELSDCTPKRSRNSKSQDISVKQSTETTKIFSNNDMNLTVFSEGPDDSKERTNDSTTSMVINDSQTSQTMYFSDKSMALTDCTEDMAKENQSINNETTNRMSLTLNELPEEEEKTIAMIQKPPEVNENLPQNETINASNFINRLKKCNSVMDMSFSMCVTEAEEELSDCRPKRSRNSKSQDISVKQSTETTKLYSNNDMNLTVFSEGPDDSKERTNDSTTSMVIKDDSQTMYFADKSMALTDCTEDMAEEKQSINNETINRMALTLIETPEEEEKTMAFSFSINSFINSKLFPNIAIDSTESSESTPIQVTKTVQSVSFPSHSCTPSPLPTPSQLSAPSPPQTPSECLPVDYSIQTSQTPVPSESITTSPSTVENESISTSEMNTTSDAMPSSADSSSQSTLTDEKTQTSSANISSNSPSELISKSMPSPSILSSRFVLDASTSPLSISVVHSSNDYLVSSPVTIDQTLNFTFQIPTEDSDSFDPFIHSDQSFHTNRTFYESTSPLQLSFMVREDTLNILADELERQMEDIVIPVEDQKLSITTAEDSNDMFTPLRRVNAKQNGFTFEVLSEEKALISYLFGTFALEIKFGSVINDKSIPFTVRHILSINMKSLVSLEETLQMRQNDLVFKYEDSHKPLITIAHDLIISSFESEKQQIISKHKTSATLDELVANISVKASTARKLLAELRIISGMEICRFYPKVDDCYRLVVEILALRNPIYLIIPIKPKSYPDEVIHPVVRVPDEDKYLYCLKQFSAAFLRIESRKFDYIRRLIKGTKTFIRAKKKIIYEKQKDLKQKQAIKEARLPDSV